MTVLAFDGKEGVIGTRSSMPSMRSFAPPALLPRVTLRSHYDLAVDVVPVTGSCERLYEAPVASLTHARRQRPAMVHSPSTCST